MNSRDAAYDDEQLRRAIEASREEVTGESSENAPGRTKRGRSDSDRYCSPAQTPQRAQANCAQAIYQE